MEADAILQRARSGDVPSNWTVWPLRRNVVRRSALGWSFAGVFGLIVFAVAASQMIPGNFTHGGGAIAISGLVLILLAIMGIGRAGLAVYDFWRIAHADQYLLVVTPDDYLKVEPNKITHVPMENVAYVTLRGVKIQRPQGQYREPGGPQALTSMTRMVGIGRQPKQAPTLGFIDTRTDKEVVVCTDNSFDEMLAIEEVLAVQSDNKSRTRTG